MSAVNCDSCATLREYAPEFVQNGVTDSVDTSLKNNTGFNPALTVTRHNCEDINDANDCLIGRLKDALQAYDVCDWKEFMGKFLSNNYEVLKAIIAGDCGQWNTLDRLCVSVDNILNLVRGSSSIASHFGTWTEEGYAALNPTYTKSLYGPMLRAEILDGAGCSENRRLGMYGFAIGYRENIYPLDPTWVMENLTIRMPIGYWHKENIVPTFMTEQQWEYLMRGFNIIRWCTYGGDSAFTVYVAYRGYIEIDGVEFNADLKSRFGTNVLVVEPVQVVGHSGGAFNAGGSVHYDNFSYDA